MRTTRRDGPTLPPARGGLAPTLSRNIAALCKRRAEEERRASLQDRVADGVTRFAGSMSFVYLHLLIVAGWTVANLQLVPALPAWDPSFIILATVASVEAIFLSTFVLITQNRMMAAADKRADLDLQINLLAEHEVTKLVSLVDAVADRLGVETDADAEVDELKEDVSPEAVLDELEAAGSKINECR